MRSSRLVVAASMFALTVLGAPLARAAGPWVDRTITLPRHDWAFDFGLGIVHLPRPSSFGPGFNLEGAYGVTRAVQLGLRTGFRFNPTARAGDADVYGRPFDTETYGTGADVVANPEFYVRGALIQGDVVELGLEGRVMSPFSQGLGLMFGLPLAFHFGGAARLDTGVYVPVLFYDPTVTLVSFPFHLWFQLTNRFWLGPMSGVRVLASDRGPWWRPFPGPSRTEVPLGFGLGYSVARNFDFKAQFLFQDVANGEADVWGFGAGLQVRVE